MSLELNLRFSDPQHFIVRYEDEETTTLEFNDPLTPEDKEDIRWYLEIYGTRWTSEPDDQRASHIQKKLDTWGAALFDAVFKGDDKARNLITFFLNEDEVGRLLTISAHHPAILSLPWELLHPSGGSFLAVDNPPISVRRRLVGVGAWRKPLRPKPKDTLHLLFVVSRPKEAGFINPRLDPQAVLAALAEAETTRVNTEFLRPATLETLQNRLRDTRLPPVDILHFDGHGVYDPDGHLHDLARKSHIPEYMQSLVREADSKGETLPAPDNQGYLLFEEDDGSNALISARVLGELLYKQKIGIVVLSACQSAALRGDEDDAMGSVSAWLTHAGIPNVLAMSHSVLVDTTRKLFGRFYAALLSGKPVGIALDEARADLYFDPRRGERLRGEGGADAVTLKLYDWFLPALYQSGKDIPLLSQNAPQNPTASDVPCHNLPAFQEAGFFGRVRELWEIERAFVSGTRRLGVTGFGGQGKTYLALEAGDWLRRSGLFQRVCFISYANFQGVDPLDTAVSTLATVLNQNLIDADAATAALAKTPTLVILDNLETLSDNRLNPLLKAAALWSQAGRSRLLLTSRRPDFQHSDYPLSNSQAYRALPLRGLGDQEALDYFHRLWSFSPQPLLDPPSRPDALKLFNRVGNHPLSIGLLAQQLKYRSVKELDERLGEVLAATPNSDNSALLASLELSLERLDEETRRWLPRLGVFEGGAMEDVLLRVTELGKVDEDPQLAEGRHLMAALESGDPIAIARIAGIELPDGMELPGEIVEQLRQLVEDDNVRQLAQMLEQNPQTELAAGASDTTWSQLKQALIAAGLITPENLSNVSGTYLRFHPTLAPALWDKLSPAQREALQDRHRHAYHQLSGALLRQDLQNPHAARAVVRHELPNLLRAVHAALDAGDENAAEFADKVNYFLKNFGLRRDHAALVEKAAALGTPGSQAWYLTRSNLGEQMYEAGRSREAQAVFKDIFAHLVAGARYERCLTLTRLGRCLWVQGHIAEAEQHVREALAVAAELEQTQAVKRQSGLLYTDLANVLAEQGDYAGARAAYQQALAIATEQEDKRQMGGLMGQLGTLALRQNDLPEAQQRYHEALALFQQLREPAGEAWIWYQLGRAHETAQHWDTAEQAYREAARLFESQGDARVAGSWNQLAIAAQSAGKPAEAEDWYRKAIAGGRAVEDEINVSKGLSNLAHLLLQHFPTRLDEARRLAEEALSIKHTLDPAAAEIWKTYNILAQITDKQGDGAAAAEYRRQAREARMNFQGTRHELKQHRALIAAVIAAKQGNAQALEVVKQHLQAMRQGGADWTRLADALEHLLADTFQPDMLDSQDPMPFIILETILQGIQDPDSLQDLLPDSAAAKDEDAEPDAVS